MREDSKFATNDLHWHDGSTCHGSPTLEACAKEAIAKQWIGRILMKEDIYANGKSARCYSLISSSFGHWAKHGTFVAIIEPTLKML